MSTFSNVKLYESDEVRTVTTYDPLGNVKTVREASDPRNIIHRYYYERLSRRTAERLNDGHAQEQVSTFHYDAASNLVLKKVWPGGATLDTAYEYDRLHRRIKTTLPDPDGNPATPRGPRAAWAQIPISTASSATAPPTSSTPPAHPSR